jgi:PIN domain nuclease of toxin-antitoxin system
VSRAPLLDTHAWIWWVDLNARLGRAALAQLANLPADDRPYLCDASLWEVATLVELGRLSFGLPLREWLDVAAHPRAVRIVGIMPAIATAVADLPSRFHRDPVDRIIVATCRSLNVPLLTHDRRITRTRLVRTGKPA